MPVTLRQLRYFKAVVEYGSFSRAAEGVHVSQPALSLQIRELEAGLGSLLFERDSHGVMLTPLGRVAHEQTLRILDEALLLETMGKRFEAGPFRVALGVISTVAPYLMTGLLEELESAPIRVELDVLEAPSSEIVSGLLAGRVDAAIVSLPLGLLELEERPLFEDRFLVAGRAKRLVTFSGLEDTPRAADLAKSDIGPLLTLGENHCLGDQVLGTCSMWRVEDIRPRLGIPGHADPAGGQRSRLDADAGDRRIVRTGRNARIEFPCAFLRPSRRGRSASLTGWLRTASPGSNCWTRPRAVRGTRSRARHGRPSAPLLSDPAVQAPGTRSHGGEGDRSVAGLERLRAAIPARQVYARTGSGRRAAESVALRRGLRPVGRGCRRGDHRGRARGTGPTGPCWTGSWPSTA